MVIFFPETISIFGLALFSLWFFVSWFPEGLLYSLIWDPDFQLLRLFPRFYLFGGVGFLLAYSFLTQVLDKNEFKELLFSGLGLVALTVILGVAFQLLFPGTDPNSYGGPVQGGVVILGIRDILVIGTHVLLCIVYIGCGLYQILSARKKLRGE